MLDLPATVDVVVIGAGIAGAAAADCLVRSGLGVMVLERESQPGYHSTGRSAAQYIPTYGPPAVWALTAASHDLLAHPPADSVNGPLLRPRAVLSVAAPGEEWHLEEVLAQSAASGTPLTALSPDEAVALVPALRRRYVSAATLDTGSADIDVDALHQLHLKRLRAAGGSVITSAPVTGLRRDDGSWRITTPKGAVSAGTVVNAAGAWGDEVAALAALQPLGLSPLRRTAFLVTAPPEAADWPLINDAAEAWYVKPDAGLLLCSPADETPVPAGDARPDQVDIARAIEAINERTTLGIRSVSRAWAGLRTFAPDRVPVVGGDPDEPAFIWLVGQGGYGIQTAPAMGELAAALVTGAPPPVDTEVVAALSPGRASLVSARAASRDAGRPRRM